MQTLLQHALDDTENDTVDPLIAHLPKVQPEAGKSRSLSFMIEVLLRHAGYSWVERYDTRTRTRPQSPRNSHQSRASRRVTQTVSHISTAITACLRLKGAHMPHVHAQRSKTVRKCPRSLLLAIECTATSSQSSHLS